MNTIDAIKSRKSVRSYTGGQISDTELQTILAAAQAAPVGMGAYDSLHLTVITNPALLERIGKAGQKLFHSNHPVLYGAPTLVLVSTVLPGGARDMVAYSNAASLVENMALAATELGVGACHIWGAIAGTNQDAALVKDLQLPEGMRPVCAIALGKTEEIYTRRDIPADRIAVSTLA